MNLHFSDTTSGRITITSAGFVFLTLAFIAFTGAPIWHPVVMLVPLCVGVAGIFSVGIAVQEKRDGVVVALILGYPVLCIFMVAGLFGAEVAGSLSGAVFAVLGFVGVVKGLAGVHPWAKTSKPVRQQTALAH